MSATIYESGEYLANNPSWHVEDSPWKAAQIAKQLADLNLSPARVAEVGCGAGAVLENLSESLPESTFDGFDLSPQAIALARTRTSARVHFHEADVTKSSEKFDLLLAMDVIEHVEDCWAFARSLRPVADLKMFHIPLELNAMAAARSSPIMNSRRSVGHIHYFSKDTALALLRECGYEIIDYRYTASALETPGAPKAFKAQALNVVRRSLFGAKPDLCVQLFGGYSLLVLAR